MKKKVLEKYIINKNINYLKKNYYIYNIFSNFDFVKKISKKDYDKLCQQLITLNFNNIPTIKFYYEQQFFKKKSINLIRYFFINKIKLKKNDKNLIITNLLEINYQLQEKYQFDSQLFQHEEMPFDSYQLGLKKLKNPYIYYPENNINELLKNKKKIYDVIILRNNELNASTYYHYFLLAKIPNLILLVTSALQQLKKGGTIYIFLRNGQINNSIKKLIYLMCNSFHSFEIHKIKSNLVYFIEFKDFKDNVSDETLEKLRKICLKTRPYNYSLCQFLHYYYHLLKTDSSALGYELDLNEVGISKKYKSNQTNMEIIDDINIDPKITRDGELLVYQIEKMYQEFDETTRFNILRNVHYKDLDDYQTIYVDQDLVNKVYYENTIQLVKYFEENKIPYNKTYLAYINKYNKSTVDQLFSLKDASVFRIVKYSNIISKNTINKIIKNKGFHYSEIEESLEMVSTASKVKNNMLEEIEYSKYKTVKKTTEDFARGVSQYIKKNFKLSKQVSNAFLKLWEIYTLVPILIPDKKKVRVFHMAEAPGNWINCTSNFILSKRLKVDEYDWRANSLNPKSNINKSKYTQEIFSDDYGFMRKFKNRWLFGADDTGDITSSKNIEWFKEYIESWCGNNKLDLITGDAGLNVGESNLDFLQKLDIAQMIMVANISSIGSHCVIKHFIPFLNTKPESYLSSGYFISYLFVYYLMFNEVRIIKPHTSNPNSGEFYLVGLKFKGLKDSIKNKLLNYLSTFKENEAFFLEKDIPEEFSMQIIHFIKVMNQKRVEQFDVQSMLLTCLIDKDPIIEKVTNCRKYLNYQYISKLQESRFNEWIKIYKFKNT